jgi:O-antigen ligase
MLLIYRLFFLTLGAILALAPLAAKPAVTFGGGILAVLAILVLIQNPRAVRWPLFLMAVCTGLISFCIIGIPGGLDPGHTLASLPKNVGIMIAGICMVAAAPLIGTQVKTDEKSMRWMRVYLPLCVFIALAQVLTYQLLGTTPLAVLEDKDLSENFLNKPLGVLALLLPAFLFPFYGQGMIQKILSGLALLFVGGIGLFFESQGAFIAALAIFAAALLPVRSKSLFTALRILCAVGILGFPFLSQFLFQNYAAQINDNSILRKANAAQRLELWSGLSDHIFDRPFIGFGYDAARLIGEYKSQGIYQKPNTITHPHNIALQFWLEFGAIGAVFAVICFGTMFRLIEAVPKAAARKLGLIMLCSGMTLALVSWGMWQTWWMILVFLMVTSYKLVTAPEPSAAAKSTSSPATA